MNSKIHNKYIKYYKCQLIIKIKDLYIQSKYKEKYKQK